MSFMSIQETHKNNLPGHLQMPPIMPSWNIMVRSGKYGCQIYEVNEQLAEGRAQN